MKLEKINRDKTSAMPHYMQIAKNIRTRIAENHVVAGDALPSERELCLMTGASRVTIRRALNILAEEKVIQRKHGSGTFVLPRIAHLGSNLRGFTSSMNTYNPQAIWIMKAYGTPTVEEAEILKIRQADKVVRLGRVRLSDGQPLAIEHAVVPATMLPDISEITESLYQALETKGNKPVKGTQKVRASLANPTEAGLLSIEENSEVLRIERRSELQDGTPVELTRSTYRGDCYDIVMNLENSQLD
ncbi:MAG: GntR family transcriptional regulator [Robiginitomaculum sp.]|nr:GntR family transcriptional regulator [Robiginitomaculum sp.]